ncbi:family 78 glycoside hydrolase catalytic domain [Microbacterium allomyrinae]|uniref:alpha-L-rhamnosidase n=1 Tax=Microbacterium allomyrinae TaxID=2830666 RepID=A0A9X1LU16_9MICO|nr:family 78 glycoside hydrolase catalytic domain [Microbacterium allomyrinae]MCC2031505.1 family 78 glycoside hydrolase catalytic domain [Microbacterium allomyrinae]
MRPVALRTELLDSPLGIGTAHPCFDWRVVDAAPGGFQSAYRIQVEDAASATEVWDSGEVAGHRPFGVRYAGQPLVSSRAYRWRVAVRDDSGALSEWSDWAGFETAKLAAEELVATWIALDETPTEDDASVVTFRRDLDLPAHVVRGRAYVSALGWYKFFVNGRDLTGTSLVPRWTPMDHLVEYQVYDVTDEFRIGGNILGMAVGDGRYRGGLSAFDRRRTYGDRLGAFVQLELDLADGSAVRVVTDGAWRGGRGAIRRSDPMRGERRDLRLPFDDWLTDGMPERFAPVAAVPAPRGELVAESLARVIEVDERAPVAITIAPSGAQIVDFGQNLAGVVRIRLDADAGPEVRITYSELVSPEGELETAYMFMDPENPRYFRDDVVLAGVEHVFQPWFSIQGFRFVEIVGAQPLEPDDIRAVVISTELEYTGEFHCSDPRLEQLESNVRWSLRSNFTDTPTDCPTRERAGWTGDIQVFAETATLFVDVQAYLRRYLRNVSAEQLPDGRIPPYIPSETSAFSGPLLATLDQVSSAVGWGDVAVLTPWDLYLAYDDRDVLERQYETAERWVASLDALARNGRHWSRQDVVGAGELERWVVDSGFHWGEWLRPGEGDEEMEHNWTFGRPVVATAYFAHSSAVLAQIAGVLGKEDDRRRYEEQASLIRQAWRRAFVTSDGRIGDDEQDDYVRALAFGLLEAGDEPAAVARLVAKIEAAGMHLGTGFLSTKMLLPTLSAHGRSDVAYALLLQETEPGWLAQIAKGATTIWERWDGFDPDGRPLASHNHYALGAVASWLYHGVAGLSASAPGWSEMRVDPRIGGGITSASARVATPYGPAATAWSLVDGVVSLEVEVPFSARAVVVLPGEERQVGSGTHRFSYRPAP